MQIIKTEIKKSEIECLKTYPTNFLLLELDKESLGTYEYSCNNFFTDTFIEARFKQIRTSIGGIIVWYTIPI